MSSSLGSSPEQSTAPSLHREGRCEETAAPTVHTAGSFQCRVLGMEIEAMTLKNVYPETVQERIPFSFVFLCRFFFWFKNSPGIESRASYLNKHQLHHQAVFLTPKYILNAYFRKQNTWFELSVF